MQNRTLLLCSFMLLFNLLFSQQVCAEKLPPGVIRLDGSNAPPLVLKNMDGETYDISDSKGKWIFVHFWATWCGPCRKEIPTIQAVIEKFKQTNLDMVIVNTAETEDTVFNFLGLLAPDINSLMDYDGLVTEAWQPRGLPATYLVDPQGKMSYVALGGRPWNSDEYLVFLQRFSSAKNNNKLKTINKTQ